MSDSLQLEAQRYREQLQSCQKILHDHVAGLRRAQSSHDAQNLHDALPSIDIHDVEFQGALRSTLSHVQSALGSHWREKFQQVVQLQVPAKRKFSLPDRDFDALGDPTHSGLQNPSPSTAVPFWWVTKRSLEQSTSARVARVKASWFGNEPVHDLCSGIGGDAMHFIKRGEVHLIERDPYIAAMAAENVEAVMPLNATLHLHCCDFSDYILPDRAWIHVDPDRRVGQRTSRDPSHFSPGWHEVCERVQRSEGAMIKLAPATELPDDRSAIIPANKFHRMWIEYQGSVREQGLLFQGVCENAGVEPGYHSALIIQSDGSTTRFQEIPSGSATIRSEEDVSRLAGGLLIDPRNSIRAAGLTVAFAAKHQCRFLSGPSGFLFCSESEPTAASEVADFAAVGRVIWVGACDDRKLRKELRSRNCFAETVKVRGTDHDPAVLVKRYRACGENPVRLWIGRCGKRAFAAITATA
jgi:hypothetical protein